MNLKLFGFLFLALFSLSLNAAQPSPVCKPLMSVQVRFERAVDRAADLETYLRAELARETNAERLTVLSQTLVDLENLIPSLLDYESFPVATLKQLLGQLESLDRGAHSVSPEPVSHSTELPEQEVYGVQFEFAKKAKKDFENLQPYLQRKCNDFTEELKNVDDARHISAHWALEHLSRTADFGPETYSIRINQGYRLVFSIEDDHSVIIQRISKTVTHNN